MLDFQSDLDSSLIFFMNTLKMLETKLDEIKNEIKSMRKNELTRIFREMVINNYKRRFNTTEEIVISALVGEDYLEKELNKLQRDMKVTSLFL